MAMMSRWRTEKTGRKKKGEEEWSRISQAGSKSSRTSRFMINQSINPSINGLKATTFAFQNHPFTGMQCNTVTSRNWRFSNRKLSVFYRGVTWTQRQNQFLADWGSHVVTFSTAHIWRVGWCAAWAVERVTFGRPLHPHGTRRKNHFIFVRKWRLQLECRGGRVWEEPSLRSWVATFCQCDVIRPSVPCPNLIRGNVDWF